MAVSLMLCWAATAAQHPNQKKGFNANDVYQFNGIDTINAFNGNLTLSIPIGAEYSVGGGLSYRFALHSNANLWEGEQHCHKVSPTADCVTICPAGNNSCTSLEQDFPTYMHPHRRANAGLGWTLSFGRLYQLNHGISVETVGTSTPWTWESPDGAEHEFLDGDATVSMSSQDLDPTNIRMTKQADGTRWLEFPDGTIHVYGPPDTLQDFWALRKITNRFATNWVEFTYESIANPAGIRWIVKDSHGRTHYVVLTRMQYDSVLRNFVTSVDLSVNGTNARAVTNLAYADSTVSRPFDHNDAFHGTTRTVPTRLLSVVTFPDASKYQFLYDMGTSLNGSGQPLKMTLPTGGSIGWTWVSFGKPWSSATTSEPYLRYSMGVNNRKTFDAFNVQNSERVYTQSADCSFADEDTTNNLCLQLVTTIVNKEGSTELTKTEHYFSVARNVVGTPPLWSELEYGLPFTKKVNDFSANPRWLSTRTYGSNGAVERSTFVRYESGPWRQSSSRVVFHDDTDANAVPLYMETDSSEWNGNRYGTVTTRGTMPKTPERTTRTHYLLPPANGAWLTGLYDYQTVTQNGKTFRTDYCFDQSTGFLQAKRNLKGSARASSDVVTVYTADTRGNVASESHYGGDDGAAGSGPDLAGTMCAVSGGSLAFRINHSRTEPAEGTNGTVTSSYLGDGIKVSDATIDWRSGLLASSRDSAGVETEYSYDWAGRLLWEKPSGRAWTKYEYLPGGNPLIRVSRYPTGQTTGTTLTQTTYDLDDFGRVKRETVAQPGNTESHRTITYDALGREWKVSELGDSATLPVTTFAYDAQGRVKSATGPDGSVTQYVYIGDRFKTRRASVRTGQQDAFVYTAEEYDGYGRLIAVTEAAASSQPVRTEYAYDAADHLVNVTMNAGGTAVQNRIFDYDGRGFLRWESHPESGMTSYSYDARGNVRSKEFGAAKTIADLIYHYDAAERLTGVDGRSAQNSASFRKIKEFQFGPVAAQAPGSRLQGRLVKAVRYNYPPGGGWQPYMNSGIIRVSEEFDYLDGTGRVTDRTTTLDFSNDGQSWAELQKFPQSVSYDHLDNRATTGYPVCLDCGLPDEDPDRLISGTYDRGLLIGLSDFVSSVSYWPNGTRKDMLHTNSIVDKQTIDPANMMRRPKKISAEPYCDAPMITGLSPHTSVASLPANLFVTATGTGPLTYQWSLGNGNDIPGATASTYSAPSAGAYRVKVSNGCGTKVSASIEVKVGSCVTTSLSAPTAVRNANGTFTLTAAGQGTAPLTYEWFANGQSTPFATGSSVVTPVLTSTTTYTVKLSNACGPAASNSVTAAMPISISAVLEAHAEGSGVKVTVQQTGGAGGYLLQRRAAGTAWVQLGGTQPGTTYIDNDVLLGHAYAYRAVFVAAQNAAVVTNAEVVLLGSLNDVIAGEAVTAGQFEQLLSIVNAVRALSGWANVTWSTMFAASDPLPAPGSMIMARHLYGVQLRMNEALQTLGVAPGAYTFFKPEDAIRAAYINELQQQVR